MEAYAVIETGGKQYRVQKGSVLDIELLDAKEGDKVKIDKVLAVSDGSKLSVGTPVVAGAAVTLEVVKQFRGKFDQFAHGVNSVRHVHAAEKRHRL